MRITLLAVAVAGIALSVPAVGVASQSGALLAQYQSLGRQETEPPKAQEETTGQDDAAQEPPAAPAPSMGADAKPIPPARKGIAPRSQIPQCAWIGKRMVRVLLRDDLIAADGFLRFYNTFSCPVAHLGDAFGCTLGLSDKAPVEAVEARVDVCWTDPETTAAPATGIPAVAPPPKEEAPAPEPEGGDGK